jgi:surface antigen
VQAFGYRIYAGSALNWPKAAENAGYKIKEKPEVGYAMVTKESKNGHVSLITEVYPDGVKILEQNYCGLYCVSSRVIKFDSSIYAQAVFIGKD